MAKIQCDATSKTTGDRCKQPVKRGSTKCHYHGGATPSGIASPHFKTGRHSKHLPTRLLGEYEKLLSQGSELMPLYPDIALLDTRVGELLQRIETDLSGESWEEARKSYADLKNAVSLNDSGKFQKSMIDLGEALNNTDSQNSWDDIRAIIQERRGLVDTETKRAKAAQESITLDRIMLVMSAVLDIIKQHVTDANTLQHIAADIRKLSVSDAS